MLAFGSFAFLAPWALLGLLALPIIWWLLRLTPPAPTRVTFPPFRLLLGLVTREESSSKTPPWLIILRLAIAALLVLAAAGPLINQAAQWQGSGPLVLAVD
ncbi:MAG: BatA domain-containing protein, partial [Alphaproteobacteria bacterium]